jgi:hypothetical protein|tara:strand:- start:505 stop:774 length:270 start_codon:yes stop_codon:yes gene_type:complete
LVNPYTDLGTETNLILREFKEDVDDNELIWHRDKSDREVTVLSGYNWKLQMDDELPEELKHGRVYHINKMVYHRLIKGSGKLLLKIREK